MLSKAWNGIGALALADLMAGEMNAATAGNPMLVRPQHFPRKAKNCIFLFMAGGVSQMDTFDYKPALKKFAKGRLPKRAGLSGEIAGLRRPRFPAHRHTRQRGPEAAGLTAHPPGRHIFLIQLEPQPIFGAP
jgi:hypothetical protein